MQQQHCGPGAAVTDPEHGRPNIDVLDHEPRKEHLAGDLQWERLPAPVAQQQLGVAGA